MRLLPTKSMKPGMKLAKTIYNDQGRPLISEGIPVTARMISRLQQLNVTYVYIEDARTKDIYVPTLISDKVRKKAISTITDTFKLLESEKKLSKWFVMDQSSKELKRLINHLLTDMKSSEEVATLLTDVYIHDNYVFTHSLNVTLYALSIGLKLGLPQKDLEILGLGGMLHDIGKMQIPAEILHKPGKLTSEEFIEMKKHTTYGYDVLRNMHTIPLLVAHCAFQHHERLNGSGYPRGVKKDDIHIFAKILAVADVFDAVTSHRIYRNAMLPHEGLELLYAGSESLYEPAIIEAFRKSVAIYPFGLTVTLNDGRKGLVVGQNKDLTERPIIRIIEVEGSEIETPYDVNLKDYLDISIVDCEKQDSMSAVS
ncbi:HD-GYP domain-containing protein [Sutcliffiella halmapala]|uniref:HD-GYP domain-containing protein n=1 Tax=Sutcliffiella halmapala TaxID=79882 RepID=UPI0009954F0C|nr:HD-GYP domain-containing protein [Sutcliffiella halmapala]